MTREILINKPLVSSDWLLKHLDASNLIILDATMKKVASKSDVDLDTRRQIKGARFFDSKNAFSDTSARFPNTILSQQEFERAARKLGLNKDSAIIVYDDHGVYSSPRAWWLFKAMGHSNVAVLDGGLPEWRAKGYPIEDKKIYSGNSGNFSANYNENLISDYTNVLNTISDNYTAVLDARSTMRFKGTAPEPREGLRSGHIPNSKNLPFSEVLDGHKMKNIKELIPLYNDLVGGDDKVIFSCGSGITACILALGAEIAGFKDASVYDGSWTEWGSLPELPIEKG